MHIGILCVGKIRESYYRQAIEEFQKRLGAYCRLDIWEVADERIPEGASAMQQAQILEREGRRLLERLPERMPLYALDLEGRTMDSPAFSRLVESQAMEGGRMAFAIGGSLGLWQEVKRQSRGRICFSEMTFPHGLMRLILLEQIYRAFKISRNEPYHK